MEYPFEGYPSALCVSFIFIDISIFNSSIPSDLEVQLIYSFFLSLFCFDIIYKYIYREGFECVYIHIYVYNRIEGGFQFNFVVNICDYIVGRQVGRRHHGGFIRQLTGVDREWWNTAYMHMKDVYSIGQI